MKRHLNDILFNGYVREPVPMVIIPTIIGIVLLILSFSAIGELSFGLDGDISIREVTFIEYEKDGPIYRISASDGYIYDLPVDAIDNRLLIDQLISNGTLCEVEALHTKDKSKYFDVISIKSSLGIQIISESCISQARSSTLRSNTLFMCLVCIFYWTFILVGYYFVSNAPRYPRIAALLIRKPFRNF